MNKTDETPHLIHVQVHAILAQSTCNSQLPVVNNNSVNESSSRDNKELNDQSFETEYGTAKTTSLEQNPEQEKREDDINSDIASLVKYIKERDPDQPTRPSFCLPYDCIPCPLPCPLLCENCPIRCPLLCKPCPPKWPPICNPCPPRCPPPCPPKCPPLCSPCPPRCPPPCPPKCPPLCDPCPPKCPALCDPCPPKYPPLCDPRPPKCFSLCDPCPPKCPPLCDPCLPKYYPQFEQYQSERPLSYEHCPPKCRTQCYPCQPKRFSSYDPCSPRNYPSYELYPSERFSFYENCDHLQQFSNSSYLRAQKDFYSTSIQRCRSSSESRPQHQTHSPYYSQRHNLQNRSACTAWQKNKTQSNYCNSYNSKPDKNPEPKESKPESQNKSSDTCDKTQSCKRANNSELIKEENKLSEDKGVYSHFNSSKADDKIDNTETLENTYC